MDQALIDLTTGPDTNLLAGSTITTKITFVDDASGIVEVQTPQGPKTHELKPLGTLYGTGPRAATVDPTDKQYMPLFLAIEQGMVRHYRSDPYLTDAKVLLALERLAMSPETDPAGDALVRHLQYELRLLLSLKDYSRQDVRAALRKIAKSVARHTRLAGPDGYLTFIRDHVPA